VNLLNIGLEAARIAIGLVFVFSAIGKLRDVRGFVKGVVDYQVLPAPLATAYGFLVVPAEAFVGVSFIAGWQVGAGAAVALLLLISFFIAVSINLRRQRDLACHCFGANSGEKVSPRSLARIVLLMAGTLAALLTADSSSALFAGGQIAEGLVKLSVAFFVLAVGMWVLALPDLLQFVFGARQRSK
jgi:uncharacterized membrane protein YphA (DoxX/SURF4 family)